MTLQYYSNMSIGQQYDSEKVFPEIRKIIIKPELPDTLVALFVGEFMKSNRYLRSWQLNDNIILQIININYMRVLQFEPYYIFYHLLSNIFFLFTWEQEIEKF